MGFIFDALRKSADHGDGEAPKASPPPPRSDDHPSGLPPTDVSAPPLNLAGTEPDKPTQADGGDAAFAARTADQGREALDPPVLLAQPVSIGDADTPGFDAKPDPSLAGKPAASDAAPWLAADAASDDPIPFAGHPATSTAQAQCEALDQARESAAPRAVRAAARIQPTSEPIDLNDGTAEDMDDRLVALSDVTSLPCEEYRSIRTSLLAKWDQARHLVHTITSATPQEGKTLTSLNLGMVFAELRNRSTIVIEADLRLPSFGKLLGRTRGPGLTDLLRGKAKIEDTIQHFKGSRVHLLPAGTRTPHEAVHLLSSQAMTDTIERLRARYDHVIIDTPPVVEMADAGILGAMSDDVLLIVRMNITPQTLVEQATRILTSYNAPVAGLIATDQQRARRKFYYYKYGYRYRYQYGDRYASQRQAA